ncbi:MAG TPA: universal stress protein [Stellaceae bacterium]|nr:universal stress protein [Stellaceae bacterium]
MATKRILVCVSGGSASDGAVEIACRMAQRVGARLEALHVKTDPTQIVSYAADGFTMPIAADWIDKIAADADAFAKKTAASFAAAVTRHGLKMGTDASWHEESGYAPKLIADRARFFDTVILGRSERVVSHPYSDTIEETLTLSGRPVLLAPAKPPAAIGEVIAVGWNGSPEAVHAITASLPLLEKAKAVHVITIGESDDENDPKELIAYLACHGVTARHHQILPVEGVNAGEQLLAEARDAGADLLVMGAFGHRPWRETLFGGATHQIVGHSLLPVLLAH